jgi:hypothetical protein
LIFAALDKGRSAKLKERAVSAVLIYKNAIKDGYVSQRDLNLFDSARFNLRAVPFRQIQKAYPPVHNPDYKRQVEESEAAHDALRQWVRDNGRNGNDEDPQLNKLQQVCRNCGYPQKMLSNPTLPKQLCSVSESHFSDSLMLPADALQKYQSLPEHPVKKMILGAYQELKLLEDAASNLESLVKSSTEIKAITDRRMMPATTKAAFKVVEEILTKMTDQVKGEYIKYHYDKTTAAINLFLNLSRPEQLKKLNLDDQSKAELQARNDAAQAKYTQETGRPWGYREVRRAGHWLESWFPMLVGERGDRFDIEDEPLKALPNWKALVMDYFTARAEEIQKFFVGRAGWKIALVIEAKELKKTPTVLNATARLGVIEGNIKFEFKDGSFFTVRHKIVEKTMGNWRNDKLTEFWQFPTTFHDAVMSNGEEMPGQPSEQEMKTVFIGATKRKAS